MRENHDWCVGAKAFQVVLEPFELLVAKLTQTAGLKINHVDEANEMNAVFVEAVPTGPFGVDSL